MGGAMRKMGIGRVGGMGIGNVVREWVLWVLKDKWVENGW